MRIDVHAHYHPASCLDIANAVDLTTGVEAPLSDLPTRLRDMDARGIDMQVVSPPPGLCVLGLADSRRVNDAIADTVRRHPRRLQGMATVPLHEPEAAARELERAVRDLGLRGVQILTHVFGENLHERRFRPFFAKAHELDVPVFLHPANVLGTADRLRSFRLFNLLGNPTDTAIGAACLIFGGVLDEFPRLKIILAHGGGSCPYLAGRWDHGWRMRVPSPSTPGDAAIAAPPSAYLERCYFDTIVHSPDALRFLLSGYGAGHVLMGSDYPFAMGDADPVATVSALDDVDYLDREAILGGNAARLFNLH